MKALIHSLAVLIFGCVALSAVDKPLGIFSSAGSTDPEIYEHPETRGVLIRTTWARLEPTPGVFDFTSLELQLELVRNNKAQWSLAVLGGGVGSPDWLMDDLGASFVNYRFRGDAGYRLPLFWDAVVQLRLRMLIDALGEAYAADDSLALVYITQMTANGIEGHLQGVDMDAFRLAGFSDAAWIQASLSTAGAFAEAFPDKPLAFEVHEIDARADIPMAIINSLWSNPALGERVGAAVWWVSGDEVYQEDLLEGLAGYPGDIYGQITGRSDQTGRFKDGNYTLAFAQAKALGIRYLEPWEYELKVGEDGADGQWDQLLRDFNDWADRRFLLPLIRPELDLVGGLPVFRWSGVKGRAQTVQRSLNLIDWDPLETFVPEENEVMEFQDDAPPVETTFFYRLKLGASD